MKKGKKILTLTLSALLLTSPVLTYANTNNGFDTRAVEEMETGEYREFTGTIKHVTPGKDGRLSLFVENDSKLGERELILHVSDEVSVFDMNPTKEDKRMHLKEDQKITAFYHKNTPVALSLPGQLTPQVIVVQNTDNINEGVFIKLDKFDNDLLSSDGKLKLNLSNPQDYKGKTLLVYYTMTTMSLPPQTSPKQIVILDDWDKPEPAKTDIVILDKVKVNNKEIKLTIYKNSEGKAMLPLRQISEELGYKIQWNGKDKPMELSKGAQWTSLKLGENRYSFARMAPFKLSSAPELRDGVSYVPVEFFEEVLKANLEINDGLLEIK